MSQRPCEDSDLKMVIGYECEEIETDGNKTIIRKKHIPADTSALCDWLKKNKPDKWGR